MNQSCVRWHQYKLIVPRSSKQPITREWARMQSPVCDRVYVKVCTVTTPFLWLQSSPASPLLSRHLLLSLSNDFSSISLRLSLLFSYFFLTDRQATKNSRKIWRFSGAALSGWPVRTLEVDTLPVPFIHSLSSVSPPPFPIPHQSAGPCSFSDTVLVNWLKWKPLLFLFFSFGFLCLFFSAFLFHPLHSS